MKKIFIIIYLTIFGYIPVASASFSKIVPLMLHVSQSKCIKESFKAGITAGIPEMEQDGASGRGMNKAGYSIQFICMQNPRMLIYILNGPSTREIDKMSSIFFQTLRRNGVSAFKKSICE